MGQIQTKEITSDTTTQVTTARTRFTGAVVARSDGTATTLTLRNGTSGSSTAIVVLKSDGNSQNSASLMLPSGDYILFKDGIHATTAGATSSALLLYQS